MQAGTEALLQARGEGELAAACAHDGMVRHLHFAEATMTRKASFKLPGSGFKHWAARRAIRDRMTHILQTEFLDPH
jgi:hypothetical protein